MIRFLETSQTWVIETQSTGYAFGLNARGELEHFYWGRKLPVLTDYVCPSPPFERSSFDFHLPTYAPEFIPWHGRIYEEPTLKITFEDGARDTELRYQSFEIQDNDRLILHFTDALGLSVELHYQCFTAHDLISRHVVLKNTGVEAIRIEQALSSVWSLPARASYRLTTVTGEWVREFQLQRSLLPYGKTIVESRKGHTSHTSNPFFYLDADGIATETTGDVWFGALAWSGSWKLVHERTSYGRVQVSGGIQDFDFAWTLRPGETFETPAFTAGYSAEGFGQASRLMQSYVRSEVLPTVSGVGSALPVLYNSWEATMFNVSAEAQMELAEIAANLGVELFVIDDGWFGERHSDKAGLGDWNVNPEKFPNGLDPVIHRVHSLGMKFGIWVEPEMVNRDSNLYRQHPEWVYQFPNRTSTEARNQLVLDLSRDDVVQYIQTKLEELLGNNDIAYLKWDMNRPFSEPGSTGLSLQQQQEIWVRHVQGVYRILQFIRERFPHVSVETCSGGGGRVDLGVLRYTNQFWASDNTDAYDRLRIQEGVSYVYPSCAMRAWVTDSPQFVNQRVVPLRYRFHVAMMGALGVGSNIEEWSSDEKVEARELISMYKGIRDLVASGDQYRLGSATFGMGATDRGGRPGDWSATHFVSQDKMESVLFIAGRGTQYADMTPVFHVEGLKPEKLYRLRALDVNSASPSRVGLERYGDVKSGAAWRELGIQLWLQGDYPSAVIQFEAQE